MSVEQIKDILIHGEKEEQLNVYRSELYTCIHFANDIWKFSIHISSEDIVTVSSTFVPCTGFRKSILVRLDDENAVRIF